MNRIDGELSERAYRALANGESDGFRQCARQDRRLYSTVFQSGNTALHIAVLNEMKDLVLEICDHCEPSVRNMVGYTPLHIAALHGHVELAEILVQVGAEIHCFAGDRRETPVFIASKQAWDEPFRIIVDLLIEEGAPIDLHTALLLRRTELAREILVSDPLCVERSPSPDSILTTTISMMRAGDLSLPETTDLIRLLVASGARLNCPKNWSPPLFDAVSWEGCPHEIVDLLFDLGANPLFRDGNDTSMSVAEMLGNATVKRSLSNACEQEFNRQTRGVGGKRR